MPELPEVQTIVNDLSAAGAVGKTIVAAGIFWKRSIGTVSEQMFSSTIRQRTILAVSRRGKFIIFTLSGGLYLLVHLRMSGRLHLDAIDTARLKHEHIVLRLCDGRALKLHDTRKFARAYLVEDPSVVVGGLGPEPLEASFSGALFQQRLHSRRRRLKPLLLDQSFVAGLGNIYVDEALWEAGLHPCRIAASLSPAESACLHRAILTVLRQGLRNLGTTLGTGNANFYSVAGRTGRNRDQLKVFRRTGQPCPRCSHVIVRLIVGQRSTHVCPACQKALSP